MSLVTMKDIAIYGAGGFGKTIACLINAINKVSPEWNHVGYFDDNLPVGYDNGYGKVLGDLACLNAYPKELCLVIAIGNPVTVKKIVDKIENENISFPNLISPDVKMLDEYTFRLGKGNLILFDCVIGCQVYIGDFNILNIGTYLGHDVRLGSYNSMMPAVRISGGVTVDSYNFFGVSSVVLQYKTIGNNVTVGANSVIARKTEDGCLYVGNPAKKFSI